jgi:hypothetical protein
MDIALRKGDTLIAQLQAKVIRIENRAAQLITVILREASARLDFAVNISRLTGRKLKQKRREIERTANSKCDAVNEEKEGSLLLSAIPP